MTEIEQVDLAQEIREMYALVEQDPSEVVMNLILANLTMGALVARLQEECGDEFTVRVVGESIEAATDGLMYTLAEVVLNE